MEKMASVGMSQIKCYGCGALVDNIAGKPHPYIGATQGCWDLYLQILAKEYGDYHYPQPTHRLTVDTYAVQHPGQPDKKPIQSVNVHLMSMYLVLVEGYSGDAATAKIGEMLSGNPVLEWLDPPSPNGSISVVDVLAATDQSTHEIKVREWAEDVWSCWAAKHGKVIEELMRRWVLP